jgi:hypothetical protein
MDNELIYLGVYRGIVVDNYDKEKLGRVKIFIPGVYPVEFSSNPEFLPWAEPVMSIFGGNYKNENDGLNAETGVCSVPHIGTDVWLFFEGADHNFPRFFGICQSGDGWFSEHKNQHIIQTDNVRVRIDEEPISGSCQFDSYNSECTSDDGNQVVTGMMTRIDIAVLNENGSAINIQLSGNVNLHISGDVYEEHFGNKYETLSGDLFRRHIGDIAYQHEGNITIERTGDKYEIQDGYYELYQSGDYSEEIHGDKDILLDGDITTVIYGDSDFTEIGDVTKTINGDTTVMLEGDYTSTQVGDCTINQKGKRKLQMVGDFIKVIVGNFTKVIAKNSNAVIFGKKDEIILKNNTETTGAIKREKSMVTFETTGAKKETGGVILHN